MKVFKIIIIIVVLALILSLVISLWIAFMIGGNKINKEVIIKKFEENKEKFNFCLDELNKENIYFKRENSNDINNGKIIITIYEELGEGETNIIDIEEKDYSKYKKTLELMEKLNIDKINKTRDNLIFQFNATLRISQNIVNLTDKEDYIYSGNKINNKEHLEDNWYYIE